MIVFEKWLEEQGHEVTFNPTIEWDAILNVETDTWESHENSLKVYPILANLYFEYQEDLLKHAEMNLKITENRLDEVLKELKQHEDKIRVRVKVWNCSTCKYALECRAVFPQDRPSKEGCLDFKSKFGVYNGII